MSGASSTLLSMPEVTRRTDRRLRGLTSGVSAVAVVPVLTTAIAAAARSGVDAAMDASSMEDKVIAFDAGFTDASFRITRCKMTVKSCRESSKGINSSFEVV